MNQNAFAVAAATAGAGGAAAADTAAPAAAATAAAAAAGSGIHLKRRMFSGRGRQKTVRVAPFVHCASRRDVSVTGAVPQIARPDFNTTDAR